MNRFDFLHPSDQIVMIMDRIYGYGMTTTSGGNLSIRDENGDIWITPAAIDKGTLTREDIIQVKVNGEIIGPHKPSSEYPFHKAIFDARPDVNAILHAHPPALVSFSVIRKIPDTYLIPNAHLVVGKVGMAQYALPGSKSLGDKIASVFEQGVDTVMLENHGIVVAGKDLFQAFMRFETLDFCARLQINSGMIGKPIPLDQEKLKLAKKKQHVQMNEYIPRGYSSMERDARRKMCGLIRRAYDQKLFTSTQGTFSQRLDAESFIVTPYMVDRKYIEERDIVRIERGWREAGKIPSRSAALHEQIYNKHPEINSVIIAHPPSIMSFGIVHRPIDTRTIPESYIMLRDIPLLPFGTNFMEPDKIVDTLSAKTPIVMIENDCVIVSGDSLLQAFDRLEVAEFTARAVLASKSIGEMVPIEDKEVDELKKAFGLE
jgi:L-fuculose-phosphate aldolase